MNRLIFTILTVFGLSAGLIVARQTITATLPPDATRASLTIPAGSYDLWLSADGRTQYLTKAGSREVVNCFPPCAMPTPTPTVTPTPAPPPPTPSPAPADMFADGFVMYKAGACDIYQLRGGQQIPNTWPWQYRARDDRLMLVLAGTKTLATPQQCGWTATATAGVYKAGACDVVWDPLKGLTGLHRAGMADLEHATKWLPVIASVLSEVPLPGCGWQLPPR